jgi:preprotein translocase subunit SecG
LQVPAEKQVILTILFTIIHVLVCLFLILVVLAQQGKGQDLASAFGGAGSQTAFGARGTATLLSKITAGAAAVFMITSLTLSYLRPATTGGGSVIPETPAASEPAPTEPEPGTQPEAQPPSQPEAPPAQPETPPPATSTTTPPQPQ